jgi:hypothetical protein
VKSVSSYKYFLFILDDFTHYLWTFPLRQKSEVFSMLSNFHNHVATQFSLSLQDIQMDHRREFDNRSLHVFSAAHGILLCFSGPYTSPQNGKAECIIRTINDIVRTLLFQASMPPPFWVESLHTATHFLNRLTTKAISTSCPFFALFSTPPTYLIYALLIACVILTLPPPCLTNCRIAQSHVSFLGMPPTIMDIAAWISSLAASSSHDI